MWLFRLGLGNLLHRFRLMILTTRHHRDERLRRTAVEYRIHGSKIYVMALWGTSAGWVKDLTAHSQVTVQYGTALLGAKAQVIDDPDEALRALFLFRNRAPALYDVILARLSQMEQVNARRLPELSPYFMIVRLDIEPRTAQLPGLRADLIWLWPLALISLTAWAVGQQLKGDTPT